jgi:hypothetical protein
VPYQTLASSPRKTSPRTTAFGATKADAGTRGAIERNGPITRMRRGGGWLEILGIPLAEVLGPELL